MLVPNFALVDAALVERAGYLDAEGSVSLFQGEAAERLADYAPYLLSIAGPDSLAGMVAAEGARMVFLHCPASRDDLRRHLRKLLIVKAEDGRQFYFRFYDPFVLRALLPTCNIDQLDQLLGPVEQLWLAAEGSAGEGYLAYRREQGELATAVEDWGHLPAPASMRAAPSRRGGS